MCDLFSALNAATMEARHTAERFIVTPEDMADKTVRLLQDAYMQYEMHDWYVFSREIGYSLLHGKIPNNYISVFISGVERGLPND